MTSATVPVRGVAIISEQSQRKPTSLGGRRQRARTGSAGERVVRRCSRPARGRWACRGETARPGTGPARGPARARTGRRRRRRCRARRSSRRRRTACCRPPIRDGLMFTIRGGKGSASMSAIEWIGASQVIRSWSSASTAAVSGVTTSGSSSQASGNASTTRLVEHRVGRLVDDRAAVERLEVDRVDRAGRRPARRSAPASRSWSRRA